MHTIARDGVTVNYNSDWSGEAIVRADGYDETWTVSGRSLIDGYFAPGQLTPQMPVAVALRAVSIASAAYWVTKMLAAVEVVDPLARRLEK